MRFWCVLFLLSGHASAEIQQWRDQDGTLQFGDRPPVGANAETVTIRPNVYESVAIETLPASASKAITPGVVTMYSTDWCKYCKQARAYFQANKIPFREKDIEKSVEAKLEHKRLGGKGIPLIFLGDKRMSGFSPAAFEHMYRPKTPEGLSTRH